MLFNPNTMLYDGSRAFRAAECGDQIAGMGIRLEFFWLPELRVGYDVPITTARGRMWSHEVQQDDWVVFPRHQMPDVEIPDDRYLHIQNNTHYAYCLLKKLYEARAGSIIDMMDCADHIAHWRKDCWLLQQRDFEPWFLKFVEPCWDACYARVLNVDDEMGSMVDVTVPVTEAYGLAL